MTGLHIPWQKRTGTLLRWERCQKCPAAIEYAPLIPPYYAGRVTGAYLHTQAWSYPPGRARADRSETAYPTSCGQARPRISGGRRGYLAEWSSDRVVLGATGKAAAELTRATKQTRWLAEIKSAGCNGAVSPPCPGPRHLLVVPTLERFYLRLGAREEISREPSSMHRRFMPSIGNGKWLPPARTSWRTGSTAMVRAHPPLAIPKILSTCPTQAAPATAR